MGWHLDVDFVSLMLYEDVGAIIVTLHTIGILYESVTMTIFFLLHT